jgi:serine/threonine-protein kinase
LVAGSILGWGFARLVERGELSPPVVLRSEINVQPRVAPPWSEFGGWDPIELSPDGTMLVFVGELAPGRTQLHSRLLAGVDSRPVPGTNGAYAPFFSPDGRWIGFFSEEKLKKTGLDGLAPVTLCEAPRAISGTWTAEGSIVFGTESGLWRVPGEGGVAELLAKPDSAEGWALYLYPEAVPGNHILFTKLRGAGESEIALLDLSSGSLRTLLEGGRYASYLPTGHLVYHGPDRRLVAVPFDLESLSIQGDAAPLSDNAIKTLGFSFSRTGTLAFMKSSLKSTLYWVRSDGSIQRVKETEQLAESPRVSPADGRLAISVSDGSAPGDIWVYEPERDVFTRLTFGGSNFSPLWSPDGRKIAYVSPSAKGITIFSIQADGTAQPVELLTSKDDVSPRSWSPDGKTIWLDSYSSGGFDISRLPLDGGGKPEPFLETPFHEVYPMISPDGSRLAYVSNESGENEVYLRHLASGGGKWQISTGGGDNPAWSPDGRQLFYRNVNQWMSVSFGEAPDFRARKPVVLFEGAYGPHFDVSADGDQFILLKNELLAAQDRIRLVTHWFEEIRRVTPGR